MSYIGTPTSRVDGHAKVTGAAKYAGEFNTDRLAYGAVVASTIAKGRIVRIDVSDARASKASSTSSRMNIGRPWRARTPRIRTMWRRRTARRSARAVRRQDPVQRTTGRSGPRRGVGNRALRGLARPHRLQRGKLHHRPVCAARQGLRRRQAREAARPCRQSLCGGRRAPRGGIFYSERISQSDGIVRIHGDVARRRQAHRLRQDPGRAERAALSVQRVHYEIRRRARHVAVHGRRLLAPACVRNIRWCWRCSGRARWSVRCAWC